MPILGLSTPPAWTRSACRFYSPDVALPQLRRYGANTKTVISLTEKTSNGAPIPCAPQWALYTN